MKNALKKCAACLSGLAIASAASGAEWFADWPAGKDPATMVRRQADLFMTAPSYVQYKPVGHHSPSGVGQRGLGGRSHIHYSVVSLWLNLLECSRLLGDEAKVESLVRLFEPFYGPMKDKLQTIKHVDFNVVGALPLEIAILTGDSRARDIGVMFADRQWEEPKSDDQQTLWDYEILPFAERLDWWKKGYTCQSRLWIDDMYMITALQTQAFRLTGDRKYVDRAAKEMCLYLDRIQIKDGPEAGLFYHAPDVPYIWGRGAGWMAAGMPLLLKYLPPENKDFAPILAGYRRMMNALKTRQAPSGMWNQLVGDKGSWEEPSATAMFAYAFIEGVNNGWLDAAEFAPAARKAYLAIVDSMDKYGNIRDVCAGTPKKNDRDHYMNRPHIHGDPHAQAPFVWMCRALIEGGRASVR